MSMDLECLLGIWYLAWWTAKVTVRQWTYILHLLGQIIFFFGTPRVILCVVVRLLARAFQLELLHTITNLNDLTSMMYSTLRSALYFSAHLTMAPTPMVYVDALPRSCWSLSDTLFINRSLTTSSRTPKSLRSWHVDSVRFPVTRSGKYILSMKELIIALWAEKWVMQLFFRPSHLQVTNIPQDCWGWVIPTWTFRRYRDVATYQPWSPRNVSFYKSRRCRI